MADEQLEPPAKPITRRMERFCQEYLADLNGSAAARRAGVSDNSARTMQYRWLRDPRVRARIAELMREREDATRVKGYLVLEELATVALSSREHFTTDAEGNLVAKPDAPARAMAAVQKIKIKRRLVETTTTVIAADGATPEATVQCDLVDVETEFALYDKNPAIANAMKHLGLLKDEVHHRDLTVEDIIREAASDDRGAQ